MLKEKLEEQLKLLKNASELYDKGRIEEALDIAKTLRTLFHDTNSSKSLFKQLNQKDNVKLLSTISDKTKNPLIKNMKNVTTIAIMITNDGQRPYLNNGEKEELLLIKDWLDENILIIDDKSYSRYDIIKITSNKDGGAHIQIEDKNLEPLKNKFGTFRISEYNHKITKDLTNHHYILLRQFAYEVLHSEEIFINNNLPFEPIKIYKSYKEYMIDGDNYTSQKRFHKAIESYKLAIEINQNNCEMAYNNIANCLVEFGEIDEAIEYYNKALQLNDKYIDALYNLSIRYEKMKRYDLTIDLYQKILLLDKNHKGANHNIRVTINRLKDIKEEILFQIENQIYFNTNNLLYFQSLESGLIKLEDYENLEVLLIYTKEKFPNNIYFLNTLALAYYKRNKLIDLSKIINLLADINKENYQIYLNIFEIKLLTNELLTNELINHFKKYFNEKNLYLDMFVILFKLRDKNIIEEIFIENFFNNINNNFSFDFTDIKNWAINKIDIIDFIKKLEE